MWEYIIWIFALLVANVLDSLTTELALNKLPENLKAKESNPFMNALFKRHKFLLANLLKYGLCVLIAVVCYLNQDLRSLKVVVILMSWVVFSNAYILIGRWITHKKILSPVHKVLVLLRVPESWHFVGIAVLLVSLTYFIAWFFRIA